MLIVHHYIVHYFQSLVDMVHSYKTLVGIALGNDFTANILH